MPRSQRFFVGRRDVLKSVGAAGALAVAGFPAIARGQSSGPIRIGMPTILSGRVAQLGISSRNAVLMEVDAFNAAGGLDGRKIEMVIRDSKGQPAEAARVTRELINTDQCEIILDAEASSGGFAVHEVIRESGHLCLHTNSETSALTADPKLHVPNAFRVARQGIHDSIAGGLYAAEIVKAKGLKRWMTASPDYAYGRDTTAEFVEYLKYFTPGVEVVGDTWPKLFQADYTENITKILQGRPQAFYSCLWGGDLVTFIEQGALYGLFDQVTTFAVNMADYTTLQQIKQLPKGIHSGNRYLKSFPALPSNAMWGEAYRTKHGAYPTNWAWQSATGMQFLIAAMRKTGSADGKKLAAALRGMTIESPFGAQGKITMRPEDQTIVDYAIGWGTTAPKEPYVEQMHVADWKRIYELEVAWKKSKGYA